MEFLHLRSFQRLKLSPLMVLSKGVVNQNVYGCVKFLPRDKSSWFVLDLEIIRHLGTKQKCSSKFILSLSSLWSSSFPLLYVFVLAALFILILPSRFQPSSPINHNHVPRIFDYLKSNTCSSRVPTSNTSLLPC